MKPSPNPPRLPRRAPLTERRRRNRRIPNVLSSWCLVPGAWQMLSTRDRAPRTLKGVMKTLMPTTVNKHRVIAQMFTTLKKRYDPREPEPRPVFEQFLYAICREGATREQADRAFQVLQEHFFDWNEVRVSSAR